MLNSWFGTKPDDRKPTESTYRSTEPQRTVTNLSEHQTVKSARPSPPTRFTSPHDAVLAEMHGYRIGIDDTNEKGPYGMLHDAPSNNVDDSIGGPSPTQGSLSTGHNPAGSGGFLHDPFDGSPLGLLIPRDTHRLQPHQHQPVIFHGPGNNNSHVRVPEGGHKEEELWVHLSRVVDLQNQVARMHLEAEGVGVKASDGKTKGHGKSRGRTRVKRDMEDMSRSEDRKEWKGDEDDEKDASFGGGAGPDTPEGDEEGVEVAGDEETDMKRAREEEFANLADQFEGRKESINSIMDKLGDLSKALTEFHALQEPRFEFPKPSSRQNSVTPGDTPPMVQSKSPFTSATLPNAGITSLPNTNLLLPTFSGSKTSLSSVSYGRDNTIIPMSLSRSPASPASPASPGKARTPASSLIVNALEPGRQTHVMDSPDSMAGNINLPPEH